MHQMNNTTTVCLLLTAIGTHVHAGDWPQWRGPLRDGHFTGPAWPDTLDTNQLREVWRVELGASYSGPIVSGGRVFTTETKDKKTEVVTAFDRKSGKQLWRAEWDGALSVPFFARSNGDWIRATPACDGEGTVALRFREEAGRALA
jgi:outer membrane protein assembly factor BamB